MLRKDNLCDIITLQGIYAFACILPSAVDWADQFDNFDRNVLDQTIKGNYFNCVIIYGMVGHLCGVMLRVLILQGIHALACILQINLSGIVGKKAKTFDSFKEHYVYRKEKE